MKFALPLIVLAAPAAAHTGAHLHPHGTENWVYGAVCVGLCLAIAAGKHVLTKRARARV